MHTRVGNMHIQCMNVFLLNVCPGAAVTRSPPAYMQPAHIIAMQI